MLSVLKEFYRFMVVRKKFWLLPIFIIVGICGGILVVAEGSALAPFIYSLF